MADANGIRATLGRLWAVARLTFLEAVRRRVFLIVLIFAAALVGSAPFLPAMTAESRLKLIEVWSVRAAFFFSLVLAVFLAGFSITGDVENRRIYTLVSKPVHKVTIFLGKFLGFVLMIAAFLGATGVLTVAYIRIAAAVSKDFPALVAEPRYRADSLEHAGGAEPNSTGTMVRVGGPHPGWKGQGWIRWRFRGLSPSAFHNDIKVRLKCELGRIGEDYELEGRIHVAAKSPSSEDYHVMHDGVIQTNQPLPLSFPRTLIDANGDVDLVLTTMDPGLFVVVKKPKPGALPTDPLALEMFGRSELFELTYFKGLILVLFQSMIVLAITLSASTILSAPVSILAGVLLFLMGWFWGFLHESVLDVHRELEAFRERREHAEHGGHGHDHGGEAPAGGLAPPWVLEGAAAVSSATLVVVPNFDLFNMSDYLLKNLAVMPRDLLLGFLTMLPRVAVLLLLGIVFFWLRDFAS